MADTWMTIEQAAVTLGLSVRTVNRHLVAGKLQSKLVDGRREVLVQAPADKPGGSSAMSGVFDDASFGAVLSPFASDGPSVTGPAISGHATVTIPPPRSPADRMSDGASARPSDYTTHSPIDADTVLALADNANEKAEMAVSAYQALARATDVQFQHVRQSARYAWSAVTLMAVGVSVAIGWTTHQLTQSHGQTQFLRQEVEAKTDATDTLSAEREGLRAELSAAKEHAARAEGRASVLTDVQARLEADMKEAQARAADAQAREARTRAEWEALLDSTWPASGAASATTAPTTRPVSRPADGTRAARSGG